MPNHVTNKLRIIGTQEEVSAVLDQIKGDDENIFIDFNKIEPMPKELEGTQSPPRIISQEEYDEQQRRIENDELSENERKFGFSRGITQEMSDNFIETFGANNWYDWRNTFWGTKWNAYDQSMDDDNVISFDTAWSTPFDVIQELSFMFPNIEFEVKYADEDFGYNVGKYTIKNGAILSEYRPKGGSIEATELALDIKEGEDYWLGEVVCNEIEENDGLLTEYAIEFIEIAHKRGFLFEDYPKVALDQLRYLAINCRQMERVAEIDEILNKIKKTDIE
jgi:hypothetical protein